MVDVLNQLAGDFVLYMVEPNEDGENAGTDEERQLSMLGIYAGLIDGDAFHETIERLFDAGGLESTFDMQELEGVDVYVIDDENALDGGIAFMPRAFSVALSRYVLRRGLMALDRDG